MHSVEFVRDEDWEVSDHEWVMVEEQPGRCLLLIREGAVTPRVLNEAWAGYVRLNRRIPQQAKRYLPAVLDRAAMS